MSKIIGLGNALVDVLVSLKEDNLLTHIGLQKGGMQLISASKFEEIKKIISRMETHQVTGGSAANTIQALASMNTPVGFIGKVGADSFGQFFQSTLAAKNISTNLLIDNQLNSGVASTFISPDGERTFGTYLGAASELSAADLCPSLFAGYDILYLEGYLVQNHDLILKAVSLAKQQGLEVCIDLASYNIVAEDLDFFTYLVENYVDIVFANEEEAYAYTGQSDPIEALNHIAQHCKIAIVKVGAKGSYIKQGSRLYHVNALENRAVIDTTGAGDYFAAGFLYGYTKGLQLHKCAEIGSVLSGYVIEVVGTSLNKRTWKQILQKTETIINKTITLDSYPS